MIEVAISALEMHCKYLRKFVDVNEVFTMSFVWRSDEGAFAEGWPGIRQFSCGYFL